MKPLERQQFEAAALLREHPPRWSHSNKQAVFDKIRADGAPWDGRLSYARWPALRARRTPEGRRRFEVREGFFDYAPATPKPHGDWHVNFADPELFVAYGTPLLAQDELQVLEHPILACLREALLEAGADARTIDAEGRPTPVTITGVQRRARFETGPDPQAGRPDGLYGALFAFAPQEAVLAATTVLSPPTRSNIVAMAAPFGGRGPYRRTELEFILDTATTGFGAARHESEAADGPGCPVVVHTGFWGCGVFGGNRQVMTILQVFAASLAGVDLVFHASSAAGVAEAKAAVQLAQSWHSQQATVDDLVEALRQQGFLWGQSDGN